jgi:hypothetical protein
MFPVWALLYVTSSVFFIQEEKKLAYKTRLRELNIDIVSDNEEEEEG